jgi:hypothetical protein
VGLCRRIYTAQHTATFFAIQVTLIQHACACHSVHEVRVAVSVECLLIFHLKGAPDLYTPTSCSYLSMVAYETYANALIIKGHGYPLWEPNPGEFAPVELGDVGYLRNGAFVKLFNASKAIDDLSNRLGLPRGHHPLRIGDILRQTPLAKAPEYISSEGVRKKGAELAATAG